MRELNKMEVLKIRAFIEIPIPSYIKENSDYDDEIDLLECYEIGFMFAHALLRNHKIDPRFSPWGDGNSVIFESYYTEVLNNLLLANLCEDMNTYCQTYIDALQVFKTHFIK